MTNNESLLRIVLKKAVIEVAIIVTCIVVVFIIGRFGESIPGIGKTFFSIKLAAVLYASSIVFRVAVFFLRTALLAVFLLIIIAIALLFLIVKYPAFFSF